jgi:hypothetical protein
MLVATEGNAQVWAAPLSGGAMGVVLLNREGNVEVPSIRITSIFAELPWQTGLPADCLVRDLWQHNELGVFSSTFSAMIEPRSVGAYLLTPTLL